MNIDQLRYFVTLAKYENITKAAEELFISQPSLSMALQRLENDVGSKLFDRVGRNIKLNMQGQVLLTHATTILKELEAAKTRIAFLNRSTSQQVGILVHPSISQSILIEQLLKNFPELILQVNASATSLMQSRVEANEASLVITMGQLGENFEHHLIYEDELVVLMSETHPYANLSEIPLSRLRDSFWACSSKTSTAFSIMQECCKKAGFVPTVAFRSSSVQGSISAVRVGKLTTLVGMGTLKSIQTEGIRVLRITEPRCFYPFYLAWPKNKPLSESSEKVRDFLIEFYKTNPLQFNLQN